ncbi:MAG: AmmeMemoRadiSam system radical SAM enzyme [bacterium]|nr:AmmeMemoRadiSam system radical SAM enzyme [bacterium]
MKEALYYKIINTNKKVAQCELCPFLCVMEPGQTGNCGIRQNLDGKIYALVYGLFASVNLDPIEKKPLYHFYPGSDIFSVGTAGCNFHCQFCQNWEISQKKPSELPLREISSDDIVRMAKEYGSIGIAYTYNEPLVNYEFVLECAEKAQKYGLKNVLVTNGYVQESPLLKLLPFIDALNIDVKSFRDDFYKKICGGRLAPVLRTVETCARKKIHIELTTLIIPHLNDSTEELEDLTDWVYALGEETPLHFSRYLPCYKMTAEPTPLATLHKARDIAVKKLKYVYIGNVFEERETKTYCPHCQELMIIRQGYRTAVRAVKNSHCTKCGNKVNVIQ